MAQHQPIAVVGSGCRFPGSSSSPAKLWDLLQKPHNVASRVPPQRFNIDAFFHENNKNHGTTNAQESYFLSEDVQRFDAPFFNISSTEADSIDPQHRLLLEAVYDSLEMAGLRVEDLHGSATGVFCGVMCDDYGGIVYRDIDAIPQYTATGTARSILSNRVSYFFNWTGPSMTIDTACSSSLVAVHMAVKALNDRDCPVAIAAGTNLILSPNMYVSESKLGMLSPTGRSRMWDEAADGYARGEGIAAVVLKRLDDAIADGDTIECVIRATNINQDGRSAGITMPSGTAQTDLIRSTYARAGLDLNKPEDRCQYFEAHGTGTPAGDPQEASAIHEAFFPNDTTDDILFVGSAKTVVGHTEGTAGLAGLIKASQAMRHGLIPPNLHFNQLHPKLEPYASHLRVPTQLLPWPERQPGVPRRASVNSFGFGGTNAHAILESYEPAAREVTEQAAILPLVFSAPTERALTALLANYSSFLRESETDLRDLAWTLFSRRSMFAFKITFAADSIESLCNQLDAELELRKTGKFASISTRLTSKAGRILGIFTGQGAQWPRMGVDLVSHSPLAREIFTNMQHALDTLPEHHRPSFSLLEELSASNEKSRLGEAALSQPLCTAVQVVFVELLRAAGISFSAVIGHSSGEIGAAYAAGFINAVEAIRIAYYRGFFAKLAGSADQRGAMLAAGMSFEEARAFCARPEFLGRVQPAASNSSASVTISGDADVIARMEKTLKAEGKFARALKVDTAYHSHHMLPCAKPYVAALEACDIRPQPATECKWFSSVFDGAQVEDLESLKASYWNDNMGNAVLFSQALAAALHEPYDLAIEVGPHPALKGPATQTISEVLEGSLPYTGVLKRNASSFEAFAEAIGTVWTHQGVKPAAAQNLLTAFDGHRPPISLNTLPNYPFDHERAYWAGSRSSKAFLRRKDPPNLLLGTLAPDAADGEWRWRNYLRPSEIEWLEGHRIQSQTVFPATGYAAMALEAANIIARERGLFLVEIEDLVIGRAIAFVDDWVGVETLFKVDHLVEGENMVSAHFACYANLAGTLTLCAEGQLKVGFGAPAEHALPGKSPKKMDMLDINIDSFYRHLGTLGYGYSGLFRSITSLSRRKNISSGRIANASLTDPKPVLMHHPALMDTLLQTLHAAVGYPGDGRTYALQIPTSIEKITFNPYFCGERSPNMGTQLLFEANLTEYSSRGACGDIDLFDLHGKAGVIQVQGLHVSPLTAPSAVDDRLLFSEVTWGPMHPSAATAMVEFPPVTEETEFAERLSLWYMKSAYTNLSAGDRANATGPRQATIQWIESVLSRTESGTHPTCKREWLDDTDDALAVLLQDPPPVELQIIQTVGRYLSPYLWGETSLRESFSSTHMVDRLMEESTEFNAICAVIVHLVGQIAFRYPRMKILEIGAGSGSTTQRIASQLGESYHSYTFTDTTNERFGDVKERIEGDRFVFKTLDLSLDPKSQGFAEHAHDVVIVSKFFDEPTPIETALANIRKLLKPGGYVIVLDAVDRGCVRVPLIASSLERMSDQNDELVPTCAQWDTLLRQASFSGVDTITPEVSSILPFSVFVSQATDEAITALRDPLAAGREPLDVITLIGGKTERTATLVDQLVKLLAPVFREVKLVKDLDSLNTSESQLATVLCLAELDESVFQGIDARRLDALQKVTNGVKHLLWVSAGTNWEKLYESMTPAVLRSVAYERPHMRYQFLRIRSEKIRPELIVKALLQLTDADVYNEISCPDMLWTVEPELTLDDVFQIPRVRNDDSMNRRYMSARRSIEETVNFKETPVTVVARGETHELETINVGISSPETISIDVHFSTLPLIKTKQGGHFHLVLGKTKISRTRVLALSGSNSSILKVPPHCMVECHIPEDQEATFIATSAALLAADYLVSLAAPHSTILVHEADPALQAAITTRARLKNVGTCFTTTVDGNRGTYVHPRSPVRLVQSILPNDVSVFADLQHSTTLLSARIREVLPPTIAYEDRDSLYGVSTHLQTNDVLYNTAESLHTACLMSSTISKGAPPEFDVIDVAEVSHIKDPWTALRIIDWTKSSEVTAKIRSASSHVHLSDNRTYMLVGMTGDLGRSVCEWMILRGARHVVLTSRRPAVDPKWLAQMAALGGTVRVLPMDVTDITSLRATDALIRETMPPIGGVVNGAMVLKDTVFSEISVETLHDTLRPKVDGSLYLSDMYWDTDLDFFILFGSLAAVAGNRGQSAYAAANTFMSSLIQRRREHGLTGSIINPGEIRGVGFVTRMGQKLEEDLATLGYLAMSEQDLHELFAEAILAGPPEANRNPELVAGPVPNDPVANPDIVWYSNPLLWNFITYDMSTSSGDSTEANLSIREQIKSLTASSDVYAVIVQGFVSKLRTKLKLSDDDDVTEDTLLIELGVDSLTAIDFRAWFAKEVSIDMPVLKIVGGASIAQLVEDAVSKLPASMVPGLQEGVVEKAVKALPKDLPQATVTAPSVPHTDSTETDSSSSAHVESQRGTTSDSMSDSDISSPSKVVYQKVEKLSYAQLRYWFLTQYAEDATAFNVTLYERVDGHARIDDLQSAVQVVANRHESLRTCYIPGPGGASDPRQAILPSSRLRLETCHVKDEDEADEEFAKMRKHVFDLEHGEVVRIRIAILGDNKHFLIVGYHHMCLDAASLGILMGELEAAYMGRALPPVSMQYTDLTALQRGALESGKLSKAFDYWRSEFANPPETLPLLPMTKVKARAALKEYDLDELVCHVNGDVAKKLKLSCKNLHSTPFQFFLAVLRVAIARLAGTDDICIGVADANRMDAASENVIGFLLNLLPVRFKGGLKQPFAKVLKSTRDKAFGALHNGVPFDKLLDELGVSRSSSHSPLFQVLLDWQPVTKDKRTFGPHNSETKKLSAGNTPYDVTLLITESGNDEISIRFRLQKSLFDREGAEIFARSYLKLVEDFADNFDRLVEEPRLYASVDETNALTAGTGRNMISEWPTTLSRRIGQLCQMHPTSLAVKDDHKTFTYSELSSRADGIASWLAEAGVTSGSAVALFQHPTADWVSCMLAIWKLNAVYVPLDLRAPLPRLATMIEDCQPSIVLTHSETHADVTGLNCQAKIINIDRIDSSTVEVQDRSQPDAPAIILYTSGSTGRPKGIVLRHSSLRNQVEGYGSEWKLEREHVLQQGAMTFNHSLDQIFSGLCNGGSVYMVPQTMRGDPVALSKLIVQEKITYTKATPSEYASWLTYGFGYLCTASNWKFAFGGGEHFSNSLARSFKALELPGLRLYNSYGPGEITISSHKMEIDYRNVEEYHGSIYPVGYSLPNYHTCIVDQNQRIVPNGVSGEILIGGAGPCIGYLHQDALNKEKFIKDAFASSEYIQQGWKIAHRTFDRGHLLPDGALVIEGRLDGDTQIKLRGIRMELEDIENSIIESSRGRLNTAVVSLRGENTQFLSAHVGFSSSFEGDGAVEKQSYLQALSAKLQLPQYMRPAIMVPLDQFPLTVHNKVDRNAINAMELPQMTASNTADDLTESETIMRDIWIKVLDAPFVDVTTIGRDTNFFLVGGNSVLMVKLQATILQRLGINIPLAKVFEASTLGDAAALLQSTSQSAPIDWEAETSIDDVVVDLEPPSRPRDNTALTVALTGATGYLGGYILDSLLASPNITHVHALAVRPQSDGSPRLPSSPKLTIHDGDLTSTRLGLSESGFDELAAKVDAVVHCGANRSFWDPYPVLRPMNVSSTRWVVSLAARQKASVHFLSSGAVAEVQDHPPIDGSDGYVASKWASEEILQQAAQKVGLSVTVHRPTKAELTKKPDEKLSAELERMIKELQAVPTDGGWNGSFALVSASDVANSIVEGVTAEPLPEGKRIVRQEAAMVVDTASMETAIQKVEGFRNLDQVPAIRWLGRAKRQGFGYWVAAQDAIIGEGAGMAGTVRSLR